MRREDLENRLKKGKINKIPKDMDKKIDDLLKNIDKKAYQRKKKGYKKIAMVAGIVLALGMGGTGAIAISNGEKEPLYEKWGFEDSFKKYNTKLNEEIIKEGVGIKITDVVTDGYRAYISYEVSEIDEKFKFDYISLDFNGKINGKRLKDEGLIYQNRKGNKLSGIKQIRLSDNGNRGELGEPIEKGTLDLKIKFSNENMYKNIKWDFKFDISNEEMKDKIKIYDFNAEFKSGIATKLIVTPLNIYLEGVGEGCNLYLKDEKGNILSPVVGGNHENKKSFYWEFESKFNKIENLSIVELKEINDMAEEKEVILKIERDGFKQIGNYGIEILDISTKEGQTIIKYKGEDINMRCFEISSEEHPYFEMKENFIDREIRELVLINGILEEGKEYKFTHYDRPILEFGKEISVK
ncbi:DUF4179 domain-containing protein [uncultured Clostridium sp.]|uniref:DUF4179 domain-containing protein n=1 Tax=uncultured Clostridium sp. TaxID=59620 RepID=UPI002633646B|nr:DUF4179 domain-containing protein [uncultured Clostridium sp.]